MSNLIKSRRPKENSERKQTKDALRRLGIRPNKQRGQNFIIDSSVISEIIAFGQPDHEEHLMEIGPGLGALTEELAKNPSIILVEIEEGFCKDLEIRFPAAKVICADIRTVSFDEFGTKLTIFGNLPYSYSTDILFHLLGQKDYFKRAVLLLQKEFADRVVSEVDKKSYGILSIMAQIQSSFRVGPVIDGDKFLPPTEVKSRLIEMLPRPEALVSPENIGFFEIVVRAAFSKRRKKLVNSMTEGSYNSTLGSLFSRQVVLNALEECKIDPARRAETLSIEEFIKLSESLKVNLTTPNE
jgi:16S rRNA (adenine1518-N6/adenine1519-N6)-dimethyltransferase